MNTLALLSLTLAAALAMSLADLDIDRGEQHPASVPEDRRPIMEDNVPETAKAEQRPPGKSQEKIESELEVKPEAGDKTDAQMEEGVKIGSEVEAEPKAGDKRKETEFKVESEARGGRSCTGELIEGTCYQFFRGPMQAPDAEFFCQRNYPRGHLASITSRHVHSRVMQLMLRVNGYHTRTWVGGLRYLQTGRFIWLDGSHWSYADWLLGEPNNTANVEDCVELLSNSKFNDMPCWDLRAFVCSYPYRTME